MDKLTIVNTVAQHMAMYVLVDVNLGYATGLQSINHGSVTRGNGIIVVNKNLFRKKKNLIPSREQRSLPIYLPHLLTKIAMPTCNIQSLHQPFFNKVGNGEFKVKL